MMKKFSNDMFDFDSLVETYDVEMKKATGRDGKGAVPDSVWETYSAMANTRGGLIVLGAEQLSPNSFRACHLENAEKMVRDIWNIVNDPKKISKNILQNSSVNIHTAPGGKKIIVINVPQASRCDKPIFINNQLMGGTYKRYNEGDFRCSDDEVKRMLAEQLSETMDNDIITGYDFSDIDQPTFNAYRQRFSNNHPDHPFNVLSPEEFLRDIGGLRNDRNNGVFGLTLAGLLMFGKLRDILDNVPNFTLDYQERPRAITELRWVDRVTTDFSWPGNLFSFYQIVIKKLFADLKVPFKLENATTRVEDTPVHKAIREAFVNTLIHADYHGKCSILVVKRPDLFGFRNPGTFRVPREEAIRGGNSDCRNRNLQKMFQLIGLAEQAGSGIPKIYYGWSSQDWKHPEYDEKIDSNQTILALRTSSLLPPDVVEQVQQAIGGKYRSLTKLERLAVVTAFAEGCVNLERLKNITSEHSADISSSLKMLLNKKILCRQGHGLATIYYPCGRPPIGDEISYRSSINVASGANGESFSPHNVELSSPPNDTPGSPHSDPLLASAYNNRSCQSPRLEIINNIELIAIARVARERKRIPPSVMDNIILALCRKNYLSMAEIASLVAREEKTVLNNYLPRLVKRGLLKHRYPVASDPRQQYITVLAEMAQNSHDSAITQP